MMKENTACDHQHDVCARRVPIFSSLDETELTKIVSLIRQKRFEKGAVIFHEGNLLEHLVIVNRGKVKLSRCCEDGREQIYYILSEGEFFGERALLKDQEARFNAEAIADTLLCMIGKNEFQRLMLKHPSISLKVMEELCKRLDKMESLVRNISPREADARLSSMLMEFAEKYGKDDPLGIVIDVPLSREEMANYIGISRETLSRKLGLLREQGAVDLIGNRIIRILDKHALRGFE